MMFLLVYSKSKASISASRRRGSSSCLRRVLMNQPCAPEGVSSAQHGALDAAVLEGREIVARRPGARGELLAEQIIPGGETLEADVAVAVIFETHACRNCSARVATGRSAPHQSVDAVVLDEAPDLEAADLVGAAAERDVERRLVERLLGVIGAGKNRQPGDEQRHVAAALLGKARDNGAIVGAPRRP